MNNREIKFRAWNKKFNEMMEVRTISQQEKWIEVNNGDCSYSTLNLGKYVLMQYTGLKDKNGVEIYELHEINKKWRVIYQAPKYVLQNISNGDIIDIYEEQNKREITGEYSPISENL